MVSLGECRNGGTGINRNGSPPERKEESKVLVTSEDPNGEIERKVLVTPEGEGVTR